MQYGSVEYGKRSIGAPAIAAQPIHVPNAGGYADIFEGALQIRIDIDPLKESSKRYAKSRGLGDGGNYVPFRP